MRKLLLVTASVIAMGAGSAFAAESIINDHGTNNTNTVDQTDHGNAGWTPASQASRSEINQSAGTSGAKVTIDQAIGQGVHAGGDSKSYVDQVGTNTGSIVKVQQYNYGGDNESRITQGAAGLTSTGLYADVYQSAGGPNTSTLKQGTRADSNGVSATIVQSGGKNTATVTQDGLNIYSASYQYGGNELTVDQWGSNLRSTVTQVSTGLANVANVFQRGDNQQSFITQNGSNNSATVSQGDTGGSNNNLSIINQLGTGGVATVKQ